MDMGEWRRISHHFLPLLLFGLKLLMDALQLYPEVNVHFERVVFVHAFMLLQKVDSKLQVKVLLLQTLYLLKTKENFSQLRPHRHTDRHTQTDNRYSLR